MDSRTLHGKKRVGAGPFLQSGRRLALWFALALVPVVINLFIWKMVVLPCREKMLAVRDMESLARAKPQLESLLSQSDQLLADWEKGEFVADDPTPAIAWIQKSAQAQEVKIEEINKKDPQASGASHAFTFMPVEIKVAGNYNKLARWIGVVEENPYFQIDHCFFKTSDAPGVDNHLEIALRVVLRNP